MAQIIQMRRDTAANWTSVNPTLRDGEFGVEKDTGRAKIGDGTTAWNDLYYFMTFTGSTIERPTNAHVGFCYFDTTLNKPIWLKTIPDVWTDASGTTV